MSEQNCILMFDDAPITAEFKDYFIQFNYNIVQHHDLSAAIDNVQHAQALLIHASLLKNNLDMLKHLYQNNKPIIVLIDSDDEELSIKLLEIGADDVIIKPIHPRELYARITAINRRIQRKIREHDTEKMFFQFAHWRLYPASRQLFDNQNQEMSLSAGEYDLLFAFVKQPQKILAREFLLHITKNTDLTPFDRRIDVQISRLRQKIELNPQKPSLIKTIRNGGSLFTAEVITTREEVG